MATDVQIGNLALSHIAQGPQVVSIDPQDGSANSAHLAQFFPVARDIALEMHAWSFATTRRSLVELVNTSNQWAYKYQVPNNLIRALAILLEGAPDDSKPQPYIIETDPDTLDRVLYTNVRNADLRYIVRVTDTQKWTPLFVLAMSHLLAHFIAGPITKKAGIVEAQFRLFLTQLKVASGSDASSSTGTGAHPRTDFTPDFIAARRH